MQLNATQKEQLNRAITTQEVMDAIKRIKLEKAVGPDDFSLELYKKFASQLAPLLGKVMNEILVSKYPPTWAQANIFIIPKENKDTQDIRNYRPILLLNIDYKIFVSILAERLKKILMDWINKDQCGFFYHTDESKTI